ncbi:conserved hypothetical protein [Altererythrobacter sp. B11]|uniref:hypothetical protein n=1 Tax=Altererythrobacter sp. B11 TaxID=2060312 RepID=UPI000DC705EC|nr:hypothetical protein [Altererythrobacter sp. B11]BBC71898.1 conserved hypothetical protein [Altererythrobacter sp. B11]
MRSDASALLQKLNRQEIHYREFPDRYADLELWPIFEALLNDPRIVERKLSRVEQREAEFAKAVAAEAAPASVPVPEGHPLEQQLSSLLSAYGSQPAPEAEPADDSAAKGGQTEVVDLRSFFNRLGGERG